jgi:hypothetical protein
MMSINQISNSGQYHFATATRSAMVSGQGDQIGRNAIWVIAYVGQFLLTTRVGKVVWNIFVTKST